MTELWRPIPSLPGYEASDTGRVRGPLGVMGGCVDRYGYRSVNISMRRKRRVHRLVCEAFNGACPERHECAHLNSNKLDNRPANLAWVTRSENIRHNVERGAHGGGNPGGENHQSAKLTASIVQQARVRHAAGESGRKLAAEYGVTSATMSKALCGKSWKLVPTGCAKTPDGDHQ